MSLSKLLWKPLAWLVLCAWSLATTTLAENSAVEREALSFADRVTNVTFQRDGELKRIGGRVVVAAQDGGLLLQTDDGTLWTIEGREVHSHDATDQPFEPLSHEALGERLVAELPSGFRVHTTPRYVVCYNTSRDYAQWASSLLERLYRAFTNYWQRRGLEIAEPEFPLPVLIFADRAMYDALSRDDLADGTDGIIGYYSLRSNRVNMFDLTGTEAVRGRGSRRSSLREINQMLSQPAAEPLVATIVHEATHQIAFNCGLHTRLADNPLWLCEGMAVYFEVPDLSSARGWRGIGRVNDPRLKRFQRNLGRWESGYLAGLLASDQRFRDPRRAIDAYADAWALNFYLIRHRSDEFAAYLKMLSEKPPLVEDGPQKRLDEFRAHFGDLATFQQHFLRQMSRLE